MDCPSCGRANRPGARFCSGCRTSLASRCPACGKTAEPDAQWCDDCGAEIAARPAEKAIARKVVTVVFADLIGSVSLHERLDAESARRFMDRYHRAMTAAIELHGGKVIQLLGDGVLAAFGVPRVAEDDAIRAVRAGVGMQRAFRELMGEQLALSEVGLRVAVNTGEVVVSDDETAVIGDPTNVAARLQHEARDGDVLVGDGTQRLVAELVTLAPLGAFALKGRSETVTAYRVVSLARPAGARTTAFVGRDEELRRLLAVYDRAIAAPSAQLAVMLGSPGLGKSRLLAELARRVEARSTVLSARCDAAGGVTFAPIAEALRSLLRIETGADGDALRAAVDTVVPGDPAERARIAAGVGAIFSGAPSSPEEIFFAVRRLVAALAAVRPVVLVIDDLHWAEPLLLDLVEHLVQWSSDVPLFLLVAARPELRDARSSLATPGPLVAEVVTLGGLDAAASTQLAAGVIGASELPAALVGRVLATSEGNPLFLAELVRMLVQDGTLAREGERWVTTVEVAKLDMPPTIQVLLAARIERLRPEERMVLERAAVIGRQFSRAAVAHLLGPAPDLDARLEALRRSELIEPDTGWFLGEPALRFHHVLIRDAAYRRILKETRAELHERLADWIGERAGESIDRDEAIGFHLEQAHQNRLELGALDAHGLALGERAARHLAAAGRRALARDDLLSAASLLGRALERLGPDDAARGDLVLDWCEALLAAGDVGTATRGIAELGRFVAASERLRAWHICFGGQLAVLTDPKALRASEGALAAAAETLAAAGDLAGEAKAHAIHAQVLAQLGRIGACEAALDRALAAARRAGDRRRANAVLSGAPVAALWGPSPVTRASGRCLDVVRVLRITQGAPGVEAVALRCQAVLETLRGRGEAARRMIEASRKLVEELGITQRVLEADLFAGLIELLEGDPGAAEGWLRSAWDGLRHEGLGIDAAQAGALLARALLAQRRAEEADSVSRASEALAGDSFKAAIAWRGVRAEILAARGEHAAAIDVAREAVGIAAATDDLLDHADARASLAVALRAAGRSAEADAEQRRAVELWQAKGATLLVERARRETSESARTARAPSAAAAPMATRRHVQTNDATRHLALVDSAVAGRDLAAVQRLLGDSETLNHMTGRTYRPHELFRFIIERYAEPVLFNEPIATLGPSLALARWREESSELVGDDLPMGPFAFEGLVLVEADSEARSTRVEVFADEKLGDAVVRLYQRHAELIADGPEGARAAAVARSVAAALGPYDPDRYQAAQSPALEYVDRQTLGVGALRGPAAVRRWFDSQLELAEGIATSIDDVLALRPDAVLLRWAISGTDRSGGGAYERYFLCLSTFGADGLLARIEQFDVDRDAEALARFDELGAPRAASPRRLRPNGATAHNARLQRAIATRDASALSGLVADDFVSVNHQYHATYDRAGPLVVWRGLLGAGGALATEPLATLGDSLGLARQRVSSAGFVDGVLDIGPAEHEVLHVTEVNARGQSQRTEVFAADRLGDAVVCLYERYAERLPEGPERARAAAIARSVGLALGPYDLDRFAASVAPGIEYADHRTLGFEPVRGSGAVMRVLGSMLDVAESVETRIDAVLGLCSNALLAHWIIGGTVRDGGGPYERSFLLLDGYGPDGLVTRLEAFDIERAEEALARFDELTAPRPKPAVARRVRPNAATACADALASAVTARDLDAAMAVFADDIQTVHHPTGLVYDRAGGLASLRPLVAARDVVFELAPLATLGESLALCRQRVAAAAIGGTRFDVGGYEQEFLVVLETDGDGRNVRAEMFAADRLGDAVARLYERHAELLPAGPEQQRAALVSRTVADYSGPMDVERYARALAPDVEYVDRRTIGVGSTRGRDAFRRVVQSLVDAAPDSTQRFDDVLAVHPGSWLLRNTNFGTDSRTGGPYERSYLLLMVTGADGLVTRIEQFDPDRDGEALARFDALVAARAARRVPANAVNRFLEGANAAVATRDAEALAALHAPGVRAVHHQAGLVLEREEVLDWWRLFFGDRGAAVPAEPIAALGDSLLLYRQTWIGGSEGGVEAGPFQQDSWTLAEVDAEGRAALIEVFGSSQLGEATARLYERHAELLPEGAGRARAAATASSVAAFLGLLDRDRFAAALAPDVERIDHRSMALGSVRGADALMRHLDAGIELSRWSYRTQDVLGLRSDALLARSVFAGTWRAGGGEFETPLLQLVVLGSDGRVKRVEWFDSDREAEALARFEALAAVPHPVVRRLRPNAMTDNSSRFVAAIRARDAEAMPDLFSDSFEAVDHMTGATFGREGALATIRMVLENRDLAYRQDPIATLGERLALLRSSTSSSGTVRGAMDVGPFETETYHLVEVDERGRRRRNEWFAPHRLADAIARLYERHAELVPEGPARTRASAISRSVAVWSGPPEPDRLATALAPSFVCVDHRSLGTWSAQGPDEWLAHWRGQHASVASFQLRDDDVLALEPSAYLVHQTYFGHDRAGGAFENEILGLFVFGDDGLLLRAEAFQPDREAEALARFDALVVDLRRRPAPPRRVHPNRASATVALFDASCAARDLDAASALISDALEEIDHPTGSVIDRAGARESLRRLFRARDPHVSHELLATLGASLALVRRITGAGGSTGDRFDVGAWERDEITIAEVDEDGRLARSEIFAADRLTEAITRLYERHADLLPEGPARTLAAAIARSVVAWNVAPDADRFATSMASSFESVDHRALHLWSARGPDGWLQHVRSHLDLAAAAAPLDQEILALAPDALLVRRTYPGSVRASGGTFENACLALFAFGAEGLTTRVEWFDPDQEAEALARFAELPRVAPAATRIENAATRLSDRSFRLFEPGDLDATAGLFAPGFRAIDRFTGYLESDADRHLDGIRSVLEGRDVLRRESETIATRGKRLALMRQLIAVSGGDVGPSEIEYLIVVETDAPGERFALLVFFGLDDLEAAYEELEARYDAGEAAPYAGVRAIWKRFPSSWRARDWDGLAATFAPELRIEDHRKLGTLSALTREQWIESARALAEMRPDTTLRLDHALALDERRSLSVVCWLGSEAQGAFEIPLIVVSEHHGSGAIRCWHAYDLDQLDEARARYDAIGASAPPDPLAALLRPNGR